MEQANLTARDISEGLCHVNTTKNYSKKGFLSQIKDINGVYRFTKKDAEKLRALIEARWAISRPNKKP